MKRQIKRFEKKTSISFLRFYMSINKRQSLGNLFLYSIVNHFTKAVRAWRIRSQIEMGNRQKVDKIQLLVPLPS